MRRRKLITGVLACAAGTPWLVHSQQTGQQQRIVALMATREDAINRRRLDAFLIALGRYGWQQGRNLTLDVHWGDADPARIKFFVQQIVAQRPDLILANGATVLRSLHAATRTIPIVFANTADPVEAGIVKGLARPGGNITGFTNYEHTMGPKWLEILREIEPNISRAVVLFNPDNFASRHALPLMRAVAPRLGIELVEAPVRDADGIRKQLASLAARHGIGVLVYPESTTNSHRELIVELANALQLPAVYAYREFCEIGGLVSYGVDVLDIFKRSASYVDRILRGELPAQLPIQAPMTFQLVINLKTAKALGIEIPAILLVRADQVIE